MHINNESNDKTTKRWQRCMALHTNVCVSFFFPFRLLLVLLLLPLTPINSTFVYISSARSFFFCCFLLTFYLICHSLSYARALSNEHLLSFVIVIIERVNTSVEQRRIEVVAEHKSQNISYWKSHYSPFLLFGIFLDQVRACAHF